MKLFPVLLLTLLIAGCSQSAYRDRSEDYIHARPVHYDLPEAIQQQDRMPVPQARQTVTEIPPVPRPVPLNLAEGDQLVQQRSSEDDRWLQVQRSPAAVWPALQTYVEHRPFTEVVADPRLGQIELNTAEGRKNLVLRQGLRRNTAEIRFQDAGQPGSVVSEANRQQLDELAAYLALTLSSEQQQVSMQAQVLHGQDTLRLEERNDRTLLVFSLDYERSWNELVDVLQRHFNEADQQLEDLDRSQGRFWIRYVPEAERVTGFWAGLFGRKPAAEAHHYVLQLQASDGQQLLWLQLPEGGVPPVNVEAELMSLLERQLH